MHCFCWSFANIASLVYDKWHYFNVCVQKYPHIKVSEGFISLMLLVNNDIASVYWIKLENEWHSLETQ